MVSLMFNIDRVKFFLCVIWWGSPSSGLLVYCVWSEYKPCVCTLSSFLPPLLDSFAIILSTGRGRDGCLKPPLLSIICQTADPLTKNSSHLPWNVFSQWLPLGLASVEVKVRRLITFGRAIFCSSFQLRKAKKGNATSAPSPSQSPGGAVSGRLCGQTVFFLVDFQKIFRPGRFDSVLKVRSDARLFSFPLWFQKR